jgi:hypothetical protein
MIRFAIIAIAGLQLFSSLFPTFPSSNFMSVLPQITHGNMVSIDTTNSVTNRSILSSTKKKTVFFKHLT